MAEEIKDSGSPEVPGEVKTFTQEELNNIISERVNELNASRQKAIDDAVKKALKAASEQQRIESLQGEERLKAEYQSRLDSIEAERAAQAEQLRIATRQLAISKAEAQLASLNLPTEFAVNLLGDDDKQTAKNIQIFNSRVNELVTSKVNESLARGPPMTAGQPTVSQQDQVMAQLRAIAHLPAKG